MQGSKWLRSGRVVLRSDRQTFANSLALTTDVMYFSTSVVGEAQGVTRVDLTTGALTPVPELDGVVSVAAGLDGTLYGATGMSNTVIALGPDGTLRTVAGTGTAGFSGDGGPATAAELDGVSNLVVDADNTVFVVDLRNVRIRRIDAAGTITTIAGTGVNAAHGSGGPAPGDDGPAVDAPLTAPQGLGVDAAGNLCFADLHIVRSVEAVAAPTPLVAVPTLPPTTVPETTMPPTTIPLDNLPATGSEPVGLPVAAVLLAVGVGVVWIARSGRSSVVR